MKIIVQKEKRNILLMSVLAMVIVISGISVWYVNDYYKADAEAIESFASMRSISDEILDDNTIIFAPEDATAGLIFYPGGKVEYSAYAPLMQECAEQGIFCALVDMPFNLAVFDIDAADGIQEQYPQITSWYIGGHSLGGAMAASYLDNNLGDYDGLILLGAYSTTDLSDTDLQVLSVYGSEDHVLDREKYNKYISNLPDDFTEVVIDGGCHAYFGMYGKQDGDGKPTITNEKQISLTVEHIMKIMEQ